MCQYVHLSLTSFVHRCPQCKCAIGVAANISVSDPVVTQAAQAATELLNIESHSALLYRTVYLLNATRQQVAGVKFNIWMEVGITQCDSGTNTSVGCPVVGQTR